MKAETLKGKPIQVWCVNYIIAGILDDFTDEELCLTSAKIVYETGELVADTWRDAQDLPSPWYVRVSAIESYGPGRSHEPTRSGS